MNDLEKIALKEGLVVISQLFQSLSMAEHPGLKALSTVLQGCIEIGQHLID